MKRKAIKIIIPAVLAAILLLYPPAGLLAASGGAENGTEPAVSDAGARVGRKYEVVYALLGSTGYTRAVYTVNHFEVETAGRVTDYGGYTELRNLTGTGPLDYGGGMVSFEADAGDFYYQGNMASRELPWVFELSYYLDGWEIQPEQLAGASGQLELRLKSSRGTGVDSAFYDNYMLQISITLDSGRCDNIEAPDAIIAEAGSSKVVSYTVLPGRDADVGLTADVRDFVMTGIDITAMPFSMSVELPDMAEYTDRLGELSDAAAALADGVAELSKGAAELERGAAELASGSSGFLDGLSELSVEGAPLTDASAQITGSLLRLTSALDETVRQLGPVLTGTEALEQLERLTSGFSDLTQHYGAFHSGLTEYMDGIVEIAGGYGGFHAGVESFAGGVSGLREGIGELRDGTSEFKNETANLPDTVQTEMEKLLDDYLGSDFEPRSFTSPKNTRIGLVQFVFKCDGVEKPKEELAPVQRQDETFWSRLTALFK